MNYLNNLYFNINSTKIFQGTPEYMPPEVCQIQNGQYSHQGRASDIWALGLFFRFFVETRKRGILS